MARIKQKIIGGVVYRAVTKPTKDITQLRKESENWFQKKLGVKVVKRNLKISLPTKAGQKTYDGVQFDNGRKAVFIKGGSVLKYAWQ